MLLLLLCERRRQSRKSWRIIHYPLLQKERKSSVLWKIGASLYCLHCQLLGARVILNWLNEHLDKIRLRPESQCGVSKDRWTIDIYERAIIIIITLCISTNQGQIDNFFFHFGLTRLRIFDWPCHIMKLKQKTDGESYYMMFIMLCHSRSLSHYIILCNLPIMIPESDPPSIFSFLIGGHRAWEWLFCSREWRGGGGGAGAVTWG